MVRTGIGAYPIGLIVFLTALRVAAVDDPWVDSFRDYAPVEPVNIGFETPEKVVGRPHGGSLQAPDNSSLVCLGVQGGSITLRFNTPVTDDPRNPMGLDAIVYSNALWVGGNPQLKFCEPAVIEISRDANGNGLADDPWFLIPGSRAFAYNPFPAFNEPAGTSNQSDPQIIAGHVRNPNSTDANLSNDLLEYNWGYAELTPTAQEYLDNYVRPDNPQQVGLTPRSGGGDAFDIAWAVDGDGKPAGLDAFDFVRLTSLVLRDLGALGDATPEIDAVADVAPDVDTDGDEILDEYETRVAGTDPLRSESTVLPLETPSSEGGSPSGALLGAVKADNGTEVRFYSSGQRLGLVRHFNMTVDLDSFPRPSSAGVGDRLVGGLCRRLTASEPDFPAAEIQPAEMVLKYGSADIAGLDEAGLLPYRWNASSGAYSDDGISEVRLDAASNTVTFRTRFPGVFVLVAPAGSGDTTVGDGPTGPILLTGDTSEAQAGSGVVIRLESDPVAHSNGGIVPAGTLFTVETPLMVLMTLDASEALPGHQVTADTSGRVSFDISAGLKSGLAWTHVRSVAGSASGSLGITLQPGPPARKVPIWMSKVEDGEPAVMEFAPLFSVVLDANGNIVRDGTMLTVSLEGADFVLPDADDSQPGYQVRVENGGFRVYAESATRSMPVGVRVYADAAQSSLLGQGEFRAMNYQPVPLGGLSVLGGILLVLGVRRQFRKDKWS